MKVLISGYERVILLSQYIGECQPEAQINGFAGSNLIALLCSKYLAIFSCNSIIRQMYKVFFKDRTVFFTSDLSSALKKYNGLFFNYGSLDALSSVVKAFLYLEVVKELYLIHPDTDKMWKDFTKLFKFVKASGGLVKNKSGEVLIIKRSGLWDLPKGKLDKNEAFEKAALREVTEECGIQELEIENELTTTFHTYMLDGVSVLKETRWYSMIYKGNDKPKPQLAENITNALWVQPDEISYISGNTYASILDVFRKADLY